MAQQAILETNADGTLLIKSATEGVTIEDDLGFKIIVKEITGTGLELTVLDGVGAPTTYKIEGGKLLNVLEIKASINGVFNQPLSDELAAANIFPEKDGIFKSGGNSYAAITVDADLTAKEYLVNFNDLGRLAMEGQISGVVNVALTAELEKLGRYDWNEKDQIGYLDGTSKSYEVLWSRQDTELKKYIVNCGALA
ncbi:hypothetical protein KAR91_55965 [Candidatus Pacearchaeota archaeon]|nr:hypothetical protein [Candidatus Pacearchaeota archaeon]